MTSTQTSVALVPDPMAIKAKMTLPEILKLMQAADEGMTNLSLDEMSILAEKLDYKVDGYKFFIEKCEAEAERLAQRIKVFQAAKKSIDTQVSNLEKLLVFSMQRHNLPLLKGEDWVVKIATSRAVDVKPEPEAALYGRFAPYMRTKYEWDKNAITRGLKAGDAEIAQIAAFRDSHSAKFSVNKGNLDD